MVRYWATRSNNGTFTWTLSAKEATIYTNGTGLGNRAQDSPGFLVSGAAGGALRSALGERQPLAALAHPSDPPSWHTDHERIRLDVGRDDRAGADEAVLVQRDAAEDGGVGTDRAAAAHKRRLVLVFAGDVAARIDAVGEHARRTTEYV